MPPKKKKEGKRLSENSAETEWQMEQLEIVLGNFDNMHEETKKKIKCCEQDALDELDILHTNMLKKIPKNILEMKVNDYLALPDASSLPLTEFHKRAAEINALQSIEKLCSSAKAAPGGKKKPLSTQQKKGKGKLSPQNSFSVRSSKVQSPLKRFSGGFSTPSNCSTSRLRATPGSSGRAPRIGEKLFLFSETGSPVVVGNTKKAHYIPASDGTMVNLLDLSFSNADLDVATAQENLQNLQKRLQDFQKMAGK